MSFRKFLRSADDQQMERMFRAAREKLLGKDPLVTADRAGVIWKKERSFEVTCLGRTVIINVPSYSCENSLNTWASLTLLQYLDTADGEPLSGRWISLAELPGGAFRGMGFDTEVETVFRPYSEKTDAEKLADAVTKLDGEVLSEKADLAAVLHFAPRFPIKLQYWCADEEFPASLRMYVDANAVHYLSTEGAGTACVLTIKEILNLL